MGLICCPSEPKPVPQRLLHCVIAANEGFGWHCQRSLVCTSTKPGTPPNDLCLIVSGFVEPITKELPLEYAVEMNRLIQLQMEGSVG